MPVAASLSDALGIVARLAEIEHVDVDVHLPDALRSVWVHRLVLRQVLIDLLSCAVEIRPTGQVRIAAAESAGWLALTVAALGEAAGGARVPPDARLGASRTLIELQGGRLGVTPAPGCVFHATLLLPLAPVKTVLVVDDNPDVGYLFSRFVRDHGYRVVQASTGEAALRLCRDVRPDAITLDILMPAQDGWDLLRELAGDPRTHGIPIVLCSVLPERSLARALGVAEFLDKPVTQPALLDALDRCVGRTAPS